MNKIRELWNKSILHKVGFIVIGLMLVALILPAPDVAEEEPEVSETESALEEDEAASLVAVPDFAGPYVDATSSAEDAGLELRPVDDTGEFQAVFSPDNWEIESQAIAPGEEVELGTEVDVTVYRPQDRERAEAAAQREAEREEAAAQREAERQERADEREEAEEGTDGTSGSEQEQSWELEAEIRYTVEGLFITSETDQTNCTIDLNRGLVRSGYTTEVSTLPAGEEVFVAFFELTNRDNERFNVLDMRPETIEIQCDEQFNNWVF